jgi:cytosine deaminase
MNLKQVVIGKIHQRGGWVNTHAHLDRAYTLTDENFQYVNAPLKDKWYLIDKMKREATPDEIYGRMARAVEYFLEQGTQALGTFIDVDEVIEDKAIIAAQKLRDNYGKDIKLRFVNQVLKGVIEPKARYWYDIAVQFVDIIGGLPAKDSGREDEHLDILLSTGKSMGKMVHVHVDQFNTDEERETELLTRKTIEHGMQGRVAAVHCISVAAHPRAYRHQLYAMMKDAGVMVISCPTAWIDHNRTEKLAPSHNSITPVDEMAPLGLIVGFGTDNISDIYKPYSDGDLWTEMRVMLEACRLYDVDTLVNIATSNGLKVLGIE